MHFFGQAADCVFWFMFSLLLLYIDVFMNLIGPKFGEDRASSPASVQSKNLRKNLKGD